MAVDALAYTAGDEREKLQRAFRHITAVSENDFEEHPALKDRHRQPLGYAHRDDNLTDEQVWACNGLFSGSARRSGWPRRDKSSLR